MDLASLVSQSTGSSGLNEDLAQRNPAGENVFKKPFGDRTRFKTPSGGTVDVTFLFDPDLPFDSSFVLASITTDYTAEMKYQLTKHLVGEKEMAPRAPSIDEVLWASLKKNLPAEAFAKNLLSDKKELAAYLALIKTQVEASYSEEQKLTKAMVSKPFKFIFRIAVDAYPQKMAHATDHKTKPGQKRGVLIFLLEGKLKEIKDSPTTAVGDVDKEKTKETLGGGEERKRKRKRVKEERMPKEAMEELLTTLKMIPQDLEKGHIVWEKEFPETATEFFDQVAAWFSSVVASNQQLDQHSLKPHMYQ